MFPLWEVAIAPMLDATRAKRVVEIGALRGETTVLMLERLGPDAELHVIDPAPEFDPTEHEAQFPGRYVFHRDTSLNVLPELPAMDAALVDGDHNWYTVYNELKLLAANARAAGVPMPVTIMHDVGWPYGRRDLYYGPDTVPTEFRQPFQQAGMLPGHSRLQASGGLNPTMLNAETEGGPRNGVMTALDDFMSEYDRPLRLVFLPIYFGLAIVVEEAWFERRPDLAIAMDRLESSEGRLELLRVSEDVRLQAMIFQHNVYYQRQEKLDRATTRYLEVVKAALLDEHYLENEARISYLTRCITDGKKLDAKLLREPLASDLQTLLRLRTGVSGPDDVAALSFLPYTAMGRTRLDHLERCLDTIRVEGVGGDFAECGTGRGGGAIFLRAYIDAYELPGRKVWIADRFRASPEPDREPRLPAHGVAGFQADLNIVRSGFERFGLLDAKVHFLQGPMDATLTDAPVRRLALLRIGRGLGGDLRAVLDRLYDRLTPGAFVVVDDHQDPGVQKEIQAFRAERGITAPLERVDNSVVVWRKAATEPRRHELVTSAAGAARAPLATPVPKDAIDLTVVIVMYNMRREAQRTLHSLSRAYQEGVEDISYEIIVLENGSDADEKLGASFVEQFGPEFRYVDLGADATPSPAIALNRGIGLGRGRNFALMIDGAHVVTPGVLSFGLAGLQIYAPSIVATQQWYVGPGQQGEAMDDGYDEDYEDRLFEAIDWPSAGYRLFDIGHFIGERDWLDGVWESNCMFVPRSLLEQVGGFDETFAMAGGGFANLELYERLGSSPDITVATILGEGSFHQTHGGTTTNQVDPELRRARVHGYSEHYADLRGRLFKGPGKPLHYVGRISSPSARRTRPRRMTAEMFAKGARAHDADGPPTAPTPVPDELKSSFTEAVWRSLPWTHTSWLGRRIESAPTDLLAYQEIIASVQPDWIVETGTGDGGRALFLASICELVGHGRVVSVDDKLGGDLPQHPRLQYVEGREHEDPAVQTVRDIVGNDRALVIVGTRTDRYKSATQFEAYAELVPVGSYVVVTDTIVNGHPVWTAFGDGPMEAVKQVLIRHGEFVPDPAMEKYSLTFNPGGFLKRVR
jgi:cephalosporin hydroxylase